MNTPDSASGNTERYREILLEMLRIGLIAIRNLAENPKPNARDGGKLYQWAELCHTLPAILQGNCSERAVDYFVRDMAAWFCTHYPAKGDSDFIQVAGLKAELHELLTGGRTPLCGAVPSVMA